MSEPLDFLQERNKRRPGAEIVTTKDQKHTETRERPQRELCPHCGCPQDSTHEPVNEALEAVSTVTAQKQRLFVLCKDQNNYYVQRREGEVFLLSHSALRTPQKLIGASEDDIPGEE